MRTRIRPAVECVIVSGSHCSAQELWKVSWSTSETQGISVATERILKINVNACSRQNNAVIRRMLYALEDIVI